MEVQGRNIQERSTIYTKLETVSKGCCKSLINLFLVLRIWVTLIVQMLGSISATDGHACMLRAMCEASAAPLHSDGLLGDALNLLLSAGHALVGGSEEDIGSYREYSEAQTEGMVSVLVISPNNTPQSIIFVGCGLQFQLSGFWRLFILWPILSYFVL